MKVKYKNDYTAEFERINIGDCFKYGDNLYIKIRPSSSDDNCFNIRTTKVETIYSKSKVIPINMVLVEE